MAARIRLLESLKRWQFCCYFDGAATSTLYLVRLAPVELVAEMALPYLDPKEPHRKRRTISQVFETNEPFCSSEQVLRRERHENSHGITRKISELSYKFL